MPNKAPVAFIIFNRPEKARKTFESIREYQPNQLFIIADGPRNQIPGDVEKCAQSRKIVEQVDWPCEVHLDYSDVNLGCGRRIASGLNGVFSKVESAIILEDDCLASAEFFTFCETMLARYAGNEDIWQVNGSSYQGNRQWGDASYYFSKYQDCWGWATWQRAWKNFQFELEFLDEWMHSTSWNQCFPARSERKHYEKMFSQVKNGRVDIWDYQWVATMLYHQGLAITPNANLVTNIGFDEEATHTTTSAGLIKNKMTVLGAIRHPAKIERNVQADESVRAMWRTIENRGRIISMVQHFKNVFKTRLT